MRRPQAEPEGPKRDRRLLGLLALAVLLIGVALGVELCRRLWVQAGPEGLAGDWGPMVMPPPAVREPPKAVATPLKDLTVSQFLTILSKRTPEPVKERFFTALARQPALKQALVEFHKVRGDKAPARELLRDLIARPEFRQVMAEVKQDPGFRQAFAEATRVPEVVQTLRGSMALVRAGMPVVHQKVADTPPAYASAARPPDSEAQSGEDGPPAPPSSETGKGDEGNAGSQETVRLSTITQNVGARNAGDYIPYVEGGGKQTGRGPRYMPSAFSFMSREQLEELDEACTKYDFCDPVQACRITALWDACVKACRKSATKCPAELLRAPDQPPE